MGEFIFEIVLLDLIALEKLKGGNVKWRNGLTKSKM